MYYTGLKVKGDTSTLLYLHDSCHNSVMGGEATVFLNPFLDGLVDRILRTI